MAEYQITSWRDLPSLVTARDGGEIAKVSLPPRFQWAIDDAAMRLGDTGSDAYLAGWERGPWTPGQGDAAGLAEAVAADLERRWSEQAVGEYLDALAPPAPDAR